MALKMPMAEPCRYATTSLFSRLPSISNISITGPVLPTAFVMTSW